MADLLADIIAEHGLTSEARSEGEGVWLVTLKSPRAQASRRVGIDRTPDTSDILLHLGLRALSIHECEDFEDWAEDEDRDPADPEAREAYGRRLRDQTALQAMLGKQGFLALIGGLLISQAIGAARAALVDKD